MVVTAQRNMGRKRRIVSVLMTPDLIIELMTAGYKSPGPIECVKGIPKDAEFVGTIFDERRNAVRFLFTHPSFKPIGLGEIIPDEEVTLITHHHG